MTREQVAIAGLKLRASSRVGKEFMAVALAVLKNANDDIAGATTAVAKMRG